MLDEDITSTILRAAIYARISEDPRGLDTRLQTVDRLQRACCCQGLDFVATYTDNDSGRDRMIVPALRACSTSTVSGARRDETAERPHSHTRRMDTAAERRPAPRYPAQY